MCDLLKDIPRVGKDALIILIYMYKYSISVFLGPSCRFTPSCSSYALSSIERFGIIKGVGLSLGRLKKCHPWNPGGYDPVPDPPNTTGRSSEPKKIWKKELSLR